MSWYVLTYDGCWKRFDSPASRDSPWTFRGPGGAYEAWYTTPSDFYIRINPNITGPADPIPSPVCESAPTGGVHFPRLYKPTWLITFLEACNWTVFTWTINPGEYIEDAIDWVLDKINDLLATGEDIAAKALEAWETVKSIWSEITDEIRRRLAPILDEIEEWGDKLNDWWDGKLSWVRNLVYDAQEYILERIADFRGIFERLESEWAEFWRYTLPGLVDKITLDDIITAKLRDIWDSLNRLNDILDTFRDFFDDPEAWLLERIKSMLARFI